MARRYPLTLVLCVLMTLLTASQIHADNNKQIRLDNGIHLEYRVDGPADGIPILFIHGVTDSNHSWSQVMPLLKDKFRVYAPSLRGHGDSDKPAGGYSIPVFAEDMIAFMDKLGISQAVVVGHSLGSLVASQMASVYPQRVSQLVLIGSAPTLVNNEVIEYLWQEVVGTSEFQDPISSDFIREWQTGPNPVNEAFFEKVVSETGKVPARVWKAAFRGLLTDNHSAFLADIQAPTLIIWGSADPLMSASDQQVLLDSIPAATLRTYDGAGHNTHWEQPQQVAQDIRNVIE
ncbi:alpha/beta fold hydrolase [Parathalassolituus penaei]|uniref:Alpha/beta hydrolase n=1 Tax=Parathalassolituus penaei TaxID=2997323 RepID=A0A9X3EN30_9GAMM|nr:alpha/beta hydrolase [Parathalassolituus penaei]MCY0967261.1 alpha/beta hydrolase [Parathalassolituus penaei]